MAPARDAVITTTSPTTWPVNENVGVVSDVMSSVEDTPVSDAALRSGMRPPTASVSIETESVEALVDEFPAGSVTVDEIVHVPSLNVGKVQFVALPTT